MHDNEGDMEDMVDELAGIWKDTIQHTDKELGIDAEYTRPGIEAFLEDFKDKWKIVI